MAEHNRVDADVKRRTNYTEVATNNTDSNIVKDLSDVEMTRKLSSELVLRRLESSHAPQLFSLTDRNREYLRKWLPWLDDCISEKDTLEFIAHSNRWQTDGKGMTFGIFRYEAIAGTISFTNLNLPEQKAEIGYWIAEECQGLGLVTKASNELLRIGFDELGLKEIWIRCKVNNVKSQGVAKRLGFKDGTIVTQRRKMYGAFVDDVIYTMRADEWKDHVNMCERMDTVNNCKFE